MSLLLAPDAVTIYPPSGEADSHGWAEPGAEAAWSGSGNLQLSFGATDPQADSGGGRGPYKPAHAPAGLLYLPPEAPEPANGAVAEIRGRRYVLSSVHYVGDPIAGAGVACWAASVNLAPDQAPPPPEPPTWQTVITVPARAEAYPWVFHALECIPTGAPAGGYQYGFGLYNSGGPPPGSATWTIPYWSGGGGPMNAGDLGIVPVFLGDPASVLTVTDSQGNTWEAADPASYPGFAQWVFTSQLTRTLGVADVLTLTATPAPWEAVAAAFAVTGAQFKQAVVNSGNTDTATVTVGHTDPDVVLVAIPATGIDQMMDSPAGWARFGWNNTGLGSNTLSWAQFAEPATGGAANGR